MLLEGFMLPVDRRSFLRSGRGEENVKVDRIILSSRLNTELIPLPIQAVPSLGQL